MPIRLVDRIGSTNAVVLADPVMVEGDWLVAMQQDAGRGRHGRAWVSAPGNFYGSGLVVLGPGDPQPQLLSLAAGLALVEAVDAVVPGLPLLLKWPNDLLLRGGKLAGILLERQGERIAVGCGVNLAGAPPLADRKTASLGGAITPQGFAPLLAASFARQLDLWRSSESDALIQAWQARAHAPGSRLTVHAGPRATAVGRFAGLERDGALRLQLDDGSIELVRAGDIDLE